MRTPKINRFHPAPVSSLINSTLWTTKQKVASSDPVTCNGCQESDLRWSWNFYTARPILVDKHRYPHRCPSPQTKDIFPGWCEKCHAPNLLWLRKQEGFELTENYGLPHACGQDLTNIHDIKDARCKYCKTEGLFWVVEQDRVMSKYILIHPDGTRHTCSAYTPYMNDWKEAKRINYAKEKEWLKSIPDNTPCKRCKGNGYTVFLSKNKRTMLKYRSSEPILMHRLCARCKHIGTFTVAKKKFYLKELRKLYWPFRVGFHKWKKHGIGS